MLTWNLLYNLGQEELSRTTQGGRQASVAALRLAGAQGEDWSAWVTAIHYPMRSPVGKQATPTGRGPDAGWGEWDRDNLRLPGPPAPGSSRGHGSLLLPPSTSAIYFCSIFFLVSLSFICVYAYFHFLMLFFLLLPSIHSHSPITPISLFHVTHIHSYMDVYNGRAQGQGHEPRQ